MEKLRRRYLSSALLAVLAFVINDANAEATIVRFNTVMGSYDVRLYDTATPAYVDNLLTYVFAGDYTNSLVHRSARKSGGVPFVIQGGGWRFDGTAQEEPVNYPEVRSRDPVINDPGIPNLRGTISMAKLAPPPDGPPWGGPDSATNEWFISLSDNRSILDNQNGGFTVFGNVLGNGMTVVDSIAALPRFGFSGAWNNAPMRNYTSQDFQAFVPVDGDNLVIINSIEVLQTTRRFAKLTGDYDQNGLVDEADFEVWQQSFGSTTDLDADGNNDHRVNAADFTVWRDRLGTRIFLGDGDYNLDGLVDMDDFEVWKADFGSTTKAEADGNGDGVINAADFTIWRDNYGAETAFGSGASNGDSVNSMPNVLGVPEPASLSAILIWSLGWWATRRWQRSAARMRA